MVEANKNKTISHILLMDDDILLDNQVVLKTMEFLKYANQDVAIAGTMLDQKKPTYHYEGGANYSALALRHNPNNMFLDLNSSQALSKISKNFAFNYGGWWYSVFSREAIDKVGLPLSFFYYLTM